MKNFIIILPLIAVVALIFSTIFLNLSLRVLDKQNIVENVNDILYTKFIIYKKLCNLFAIISIFVVILVILSYLGYI